MGFLLRASFFLLIFFVSCTKTYIGSDVCGADEFVYDSYKIREGKLAILEMGGIFLDEIDEDLVSVAKEPGSVMISQSMRNEKIEVDGKMHLLDVLTHLRDLENVNLFKSYVSRKGKIIPVDFCRLLHDGDMDQNIYLEGGDTLYLAEGPTASVLIVGAGGFQKEISLSTGSMPIRKALGLSSSLPYLNDNPVIQIVRASMKKPKIYTLDFEHIRLLPDESLLVIPGDIIYVCSTIDSKWHRFISLFFPPLEEINKTN